jgi:uncharacterized NAD-dependent epimerase/dehydratase family protein
VTDAPRYALLAEGHFRPRDAKTAEGVLRYRPERAAAVIDSTRAGSTAQECVGCGGDVPVVADLDAAARAGANALLLGIAPQGGELPEAWRAIVRDALRRGFDVVGGLHQFLGDDPELAALAREHGARLIDVRRPPAGRPIAARRAAALNAHVVLTVGSDCNCGKMTTTFELERALVARGVRTAVVATGQTGILVAGGGVAVDAVVGDFAAGVVERMVIDAAENADVVVVEGQGALHHPGYSGVSLALLHGACPASMVLCHQEGRTLLRTGGVTDVQLPPLTAVRDAAETAAAWVRTARVVAVALDTSELDDDAARAACDARARELSVPATDPLRFGADAIADAVLAARERVSKTQDATAVTAIGQGRSR